MNAYPLLAWNNLLGGSPEPTVTHSADAEGYPFANLSDWRPYTFWRSSESGALYIKLDAGPLPGQTATVDTLALAGHNFKTAGVSGVGLFWSDDDSEYSPCLPAFDPENDRVIFRAFPAQTRRYFKLIIPPGYSEPPRIGILFLGRSTVLPAYPDPGFDPDSQEVELAQEHSRRGHLLGIAECFRRREIRLSFSRLPPNFISEELVPFFSAHGLRPCFFAWDHQGHPQEAYLVRLAVPRLEAPYDRAFRSLTMNLTGAVED